MPVQSIKKTALKLYKALKSSIPYRIKRVDTGFDSESDRSRVFLAIVDGMDTRVKEVEKHGDDMVLEYEDKTCAITSKPLLIDGNQLYVTRDGFIGTMALNKDTLLASDVWQNTSGKSTRKISKDIDFTELEINPEKEAYDEDDDYYYVKNDQIGDIAELSGSKKTLRDVNEAKRLRKLLEPSSMDKKKLIMAIGAGAALGIYMYPYVMQG